MKEYTYTETEYFILQHLYYSMGVNRMKWYEYRELMIPSLKEEIMVVLGNSKNLNPHYGGESEVLWIKECQMSKYNSHDIDTVIRKIKEKFQIFGHYEGYSEVNDSIQRYSWGQ